MVLRSRLFPDFFFIHFILDFFLPSSPATPNTCCHKYSGKNVSPINLSPGGGVYTAISFTPPPCRCLSPCPCPSVMPPLPRPSLLHSPSLSNLWKYFLYQIFPQIFCFDKRRCGLPAPTVYTYTHIRESISAYIHTDRRAERQTDR